MKITWFGHASFRIEIEEAVLLVDPWIEGNPVFPQERRSEVLSGATHILLTHGHGDHASNAVKLSQELGITVACIHELAKRLGAKGADTLGFGKGGTIDCGGAKVTMVNATHSSSIDFEGEPLAAGSEAGFMISGEGHTIYVTGDTDIMADMAWMGEYHKPDIGLLCCGGHFTMDMERAAWAAKRYFNFSIIVPCHYKTFPLLAQSADPLVAALPDIDVRALDVMETLEI